MDTRKPHFFCDNCGAEVPRSAKSCPRCGRFFASVRCPRCGFTGQDGDFTRGCPACGYSAPPPTPPGAEGRRGNPAAPRPGQTAETGPALPLWLYLVSAVALLGVLAILYNMLF